MDPVTLHGRLDHIAWEARGGGRRLPVLALHGLTDAAVGWWPALGGIAQTRRVVAVDARGHGDTALTDEPFSIAALAADAARVVREVVGEPVVVVGHSMGGLVAEELALTEPDLVRAVVLEDPAWVAAHDPHDDRGVPVWLPEIIAASAGRTRDELVAASRAECPGWPDDEHEASGSARERLSAHLLDREHAWAERDWVEAMAGVRAPVTLITGDTSCGALVDAAQTARVAEALGDRFTNVPVPGVGHCIRRENRAAFVAALEAALDAADAAAAVPAGGALAGPTP